MSFHKSLWVNSILFLGLGIGFMYLAFQKVSFDQIGEVLKTANYSVVFPVFAVSVIVYIARVKRWKLLVEKSGYQASEKQLLASLVGGYLVNFAVPRLGELSRTLILKRTMKLPINTGLSTVIFERLTDIVCLILIVLIASLLEWINQGTLFNHFTSGVVWLSKSKIILLVIGIIVSIAIYIWLRKTKAAWTHWILQIVETLKKLIWLETRNTYLLYTLIIWIGFFLMTYLWFFMFKESSGLSVYDAYLVMTLGVIARSLPIQAGSAGAYHFVVGQALVLLGLNQIYANTLAIVIHGFQTILTLLFGSIAFFWLAIRKDV